jgi:hypothetical protein
MIVLQSRTSQQGADAGRVWAFAAYKDFLALRKDADPGIPLLKEAKAQVREVAAAWSPHPDHRSRYLQSRNS